MSFFIRKKTNNTTKRKNSILNNKKHKIQKVKLKDYDEEIESDIDEENISQKTQQNNEEEEQETAQEKKIRLAKLYLSEIEQEEKKRIELESFNKPALAQRLNDDFLEQAGKLKKSIADSLEPFDLNQVQILKCKLHKLSLTCLVLSTDCSFIYSGSKDGSLVRWSLTNKCKDLFVKQIPEDMKTNKYPSTILSLALSSDGKFLASGLANSNILIWCPQNLTHLHTFHGHKGPVTGVVFRKGSQDLYSCSHDKSVKVWNLTEKAYIETLFGHQFEITSIDALSLERAITSGGRDNTIRIWKFIQESQLIFNGLNKSNIEIVKLINEDNFISGDDDGNLCLWTSLKKKPIFTIKSAHGICSENKQPFWITSIATLINTDIVASGSHNGYIQIWKCENFQSLIRMFQIPVIGFINHLAFTSDGNYLIAGIGQEHKAGRWWTYKNTKNGIKK